MTATGAERWRQLEGRSSWVPCHALCAGSGSGDALLMALGIAIVANTRPYEGFVLSLTAGVALDLGRAEKEIAR